MICIMLALLTCSIKVSEILNVNANCAAFFNRGYIFWTPGLGWKCPIK